VAGASEGHIEPLLVLHKPHTTPIVAAAHRHDANIRLAPLRTSDKRGKKGLITKIPQNILLTNLPTFPIP
jgi:hypothetical protein